MSRPIPGVQSLEYRKNGLVTQRCSRCHQERSQSSLFVRPDPVTQMQPVMVGSDLVGVVCHDCVHSIEKHIQAVFPDRHAFPFVSDRGELLPTPRCELGHTLVYAADGRSMVCEQCDAEGDAPMDA